MNIPKIDSSFFTWSKWRAGSLLDLGIKTRISIIKQNRMILRKHAIGWCHGRNLNCRPKENEVAVMFCGDGLEFWTHLRYEELQILQITPHK